MNETLIELVWERAHGRCEYCQLPQVFTTCDFEIDHIIAKKHRGRTAASNLALTCFFCNSAKGPNIAGLDPRTQKITPLFHPRRHKWNRHFRWDGPVLVGMTAIGRATIAVLNINEAQAVATRAALIQTGVFGPERFRPD